MMKLSIKIPLLAISFAFLATLLTFSLMAHRHYDVVSKLIKEKIELINSTFDAKFENFSVNKMDSVRMKDKLAFSYSRIFSYFEEMPGITYMVLLDPKLNVIQFRLITSQGSSLVSYRGKYGKAISFDRKKIEENVPKVWGSKRTGLVFTSPEGIRLEIKRENLFKKTWRVIREWFGAAPEKWIGIVQVRKPVFLPGQSKTPFAYIEVGMSVAYLRDFIVQDLKHLAVPLLLLFFVLVALAVFTSLDIVQAIGKLSKGAEELGAENFNHKIEMKRKDELGRWAEIFNAMSKKLKTMITELKEKYAEVKKLFKLATEDGLTKTFVHRYLMDILENELKRSKRNGGFTSFVMCDIDHFKKFNDTYGHQTGDYVLAKVAEVYLSNVRQNLDTVGRYGGEEFGIILPETDKRGAMIAAEKVRKAIESAKYEFNGNTFSVNISLGVSTVKAGSADKEQLVKWADKALYHSKENGRNRTSFFSGDKNA
jgi:diguanylate cyclase (GGDEF)-like protein